MTPDRVAAALAEAAVALGTVLPVGNTVGPLLDHSDPNALIPGEGARAVTATLSGYHRARVVLALSAETAGAIENGPLGQQELTAATERPLADALASLAAILGEPLQLEAVQALDADLAVATAAQEVLESGGQLIGVPLLNGTVHASSLVLALPPDHALLGDQALLAEEALLADEAAGGVELPDLEEAGPGPAPRLNDDSLALLAGVEMQVTVELGRTRLTVRDLLSLSPGGVVELDRAAGSPVDLFVNGTPIARGEIVIVEECFGVRITEIVRRDPGRHPNG
jgi:flagellar motor switch protein FliN/FliY